MTQCQEVQVGGAGVVVGASRLPSLWSSRRISNQKPFEYFGSAIQSLSPVTVIVLILFAVVAAVGVAAHHYRKKLPKSWRQSWKAHHGMYTFIGMISLGVLVILATGGGTI